MIQIRLKKECKLKVIQPHCKPDGNMEVDRSVYYYCWKRDRGSLLEQQCFLGLIHTVKILKFGTPQTIAIIVLKIEKFDVTLH